VLKDWSDEELAYWLVGLDSESGVKGGWSYVSSDEGYIGWADYIFRWRISDCV